MKRRRRDEKKSKEEEEERKERNQRKKKRRTKKNELNHILLHCIIIQYCISSRSCRLRNLIRKLGLGLGDI